MPGLIDQATSDWRRFSSDLDGFATTITFTAPTAEIAIVAGLAMKHHISIDSEGNPINSKNAHISVSEKLLTDVAYPTRNTAGEVDLLNHKVEYVDSTGISKEYSVQQNFPDETIGMITCILQDFE